MRKRFHGLKKIKVRQSWHKYNLYNLSHMKIPNVTERTYFQQKWTAKSITRAYHGEQIREKQWQRMFKRRIASVVPMDHRYLAQHDGSEQGAGRGSGVDPPPGQRPKPIPRTPYMNMVYAPTERRLDTAIFRALFASSTRQARQFVVHGAVRVNGKRMIYPGYLLNPGDMFQVEPERVLFATGASKDKKERRAGRKLSRKSSATEEATADSEEASETAEPSAAATPSESGDKPTSASEPTDSKKQLTSLLNRAKSMLANPKDTLSAKHKQDLRAFQRTLKKTIARTSTRTSLTDDLDAQLLELTSKLSLSSSPAQSTPDQTQHQQQQQQQLQTPDQLSPDDKRALKLALQAARENPIDVTKPYATPWRPRPFMSAFAFIPRYLEVNQNVCSAVYLRHPVARPGLGEVPTPFNSETNQLAFNWYLRRR
ncbi:mitochondrial 37S ribosomal protein nam9 [Acarospora aff. strigata]|nr:mitochondrial 37S ribosomal protein nam9 [Acarospora aff. strigata]